MSKTDITDRVEPIRLTDSETGEKYVLEFSRETVKFAEARKFVIGELTDYVNTNIPELWFYAFRKNHRNIAREKTDKILFEDLQGLEQKEIERLYRLYMQPANALIRSDEDGERKNARMTVEL